MSKKTGDFGDSLPQWECLVRSKSIKKLKYAFRNSKNIANLIINMYLCTR